MRARTDPGLQPPGATLSWLDPDRVRSALPVPTGARVLAACSSGACAFALAIAGAEQVIQVAPDDAGLALAELQLVGAHALPVEGLRNLLGYDQPGRRVFLYHQMRGALSPRGRAYWDAHEALLREGLVDAGALERHLAHFRQRVLPVLHPEARISTLFSLSTPAEVLEFLTAHWESPAWRLAVRACFAPAVLARLRVPDPELWREPVGVWSRILRAGLPAENALLQRALRGPSRAPWPLHLTEEGHARLAAAAHRVRLEQGPVSAVLERLPPGSLRFASFRGPSLDGLPHALAAGGRALVWGETGPLPRGLDLVSPAPELALDRWPIHGASRLLQRT